MLRVHFRSKSSSLSSGHIRLARYRSNRTSVCRAMRCRCLVKKSGHCRNRNQFPQSRHTHPSRNKAFMSCIGGIMWRVTSGTTAMSLCRVRCQPSHVGGSLPTKFSTLRRYSKQSCKYTGDFNPQSTPTKCRPWLWNWSRRFSI